MSQNQTESKPPSVEKPRNEGLDGTHCSPRLVSVNDLYMACKPLTKDYGKVDHRDMLLAIVTRCHEILIQENVPVVAPATPNYKSDRTEARKPVAGSVMLKTLCTKCQKQMKCFWPEKTTWGGVECTASEYMAKAILSENVGIYCDDCLEKMPDVKLEDLCYE